MRQAGMPAWLACSKVYKSDDTPSRSRRAAQSAFVSLCFESKQTLILMTLGTLRTVPNRSKRKANPTEITLPGWLFFGRANLCCFQRLFVILIYDIVTDDRHGDHDITC